jgi:hypothetical protein
VAWKRNDDEADGGLCWKKALQMKPVVGESGKEEEEGLGWLSDDEMNWPMLRLFGVGWKEHMPEEEMEGRHGWMSAGEKHEPKRRLPVGGLKE